MKNIRLQRYKSPCGSLLLGSYEDTLCLCSWECNEGLPGHIANLLKAELTASPSDITKEATHQLDEYFKGNRQSFNIALYLIGTTFQKKVWDALTSIPYNATTTYLSIASQTGNPLAVRAVAQAIGKNPISLFIPCHRVIGTDHKLTGYNGGLEAKAFLLNLERKQTDG